MIKTTFNTLTLENTIKDQMRLLEIERLLESLPDLKKEREMLISELSKVDFKSLYEDIECKYEILVDDYHEKYLENLDDLNTILNMISIKYFHNDFEVIDMADDESKLYYIQKKQGGQVIDQIKVVIENV